MTTATAEPLLADEETKQVLGWRLHELKRSGYDWEDALTLALRPDVDLHVACDLLRNGCPTPTALRILL